MLTGVDGAFKLGYTPSPGSTVSGGAATPYFNRRLDERILQASIDFGAASNLPRPSSEAAKRGLRFERKVLSALHSAFDGRFASQLPFSFKTQSKRGRAILDGLLLSRDGSALCLIEVKSIHCADAWHQLENFYLPIVRDAVRGVFRICLLEVVRVFDPWVRLPKAVALVSNPEEAFEASESFLPVLATRDGGFSHAELCPRDSALHPDPVHRGAS